MSVSSPEISLTSSSSSSKDDVEYWEINPPAVSRLSSMDCWDYTIELECLKGPEDLQLAAELGKTLLERNKELEGSIKQQQNIIDDQSQEIEYLTKQNNALREVNDTRLKIYETIEISIQELEKTNYKLNIDIGNAKKQNKTLTATNETLEEKCEDLRKQVDDLNHQVENERRKTERILQEQRTKTKDDSSKISPMVCLPATTATTPAVTLQNNGNNKDQTMIQNMVTLSASLAETIALSSDLIDGAENCDNDYILHVMTELDGTKRQLAFEQHHISELEEQLSALIQENQTLQNCIAKNATEGEEMRSMHDELSILEEAGQGKMCRRCLRSFDDDTLLVPDYASSIACTEDGDDASLVEMLQTHNSQTMYCTPSIAQAECVICSSTTKYLHAIPVSLIAILLELWLHFKHNVSIIQWTLKILQWPAIFFYRMIESPNFDSLEFM